VFSGPTPTAWSWTGSSVSPGLSSIHSSGWVKHRLTSHTSSSAWTTHTHTHTHTHTYITHMYTQTNKQKHTHTHTHTHKQWMWAHLMRYVYKAHGVTSLHGPPTYKSYQLDHYPDQHDSE